MEKELVVLAVIFLLIAGLWAYFIRVAYCVYKSKNYRNSKRPVFEFFADIG